MIAVPKWRVIAVFALLAACVGALGVKAGRLQLLLGDDLRGLAENQYLRKIQVAAPRGNITDVKGRPLAVSVPAVSVSARPNLVEDKAAAAKALAPLLNEDERDVATKLSSAEKFVWLKRRAAADVADGVRALGIPGVELKSDVRRMWPQKTSAGQLLGLVDVDGKAAGGVEQAFDESLEGRAQQAPALADNKGDRIALADGIDLDLVDGDTVALTIDLEVQHEADLALASAVVEHQAKAGWAMAMDPKTGAILAVSNYPPFNPNAPETKDARNKVFAEAFEPGSIFKIATFAAALEAGVVKPDDRIFCENGRYQIGKHIIHDTHKAEWLSATQVFQESSNIGTLKIGQRLGEDALRSSLTKYHFGARPGTGLLEESSGRLPAGNKWGEARLATVSFGHGVMVTALQMASLAQAVANGGVRKTPYLLSKVTSPLGETVKSAQLDEGERIMSAGVAKTLTDIMKTVEKEGGTGTLAAIPGIEVAGKTGTAEKVDPVTHKYSDQMHMTSFVGFAPADDPKVVAIVVLDDPQGSAHFGGIGAAPAWKRIVERALVEDGVLVQGQLDKLAVVAAKTMKPEKAAKLAKDAREGSELDEVASGKEVAVASKSASGAQDGDTAHAGLVPELKGMSARAAMKTAESAGATLVVDGSGLVVSQEPAAGKAMPSDAMIKVTLADASTVDIAPVSRTSSVTALTSGGAASASVSEAGSKSGDAARAKASKTLKGGASETSKSGASSHAATAASDEDRAPLKPAHRAKKAKKSEENE